MSIGPHGAIQYHLDACRRCTGGMINYRACKSKPKPNPHGRHPKSKHGTRKPLESSVSYIPLHHHVLSSMHHHPTQIQPVSIGERPKSSSHGAPRPDPRALRLKFGTARRWVLLLAHLPHLDVVTVAHRQSASPPYPPSKHKNKTKKQRTEKRSRNPQTRLRNPGCTRHL
jgi:hypothetical protein